MNLPPEIIPVKGDIKLAILEIDFRVQFTDVLRNEVAHRNTSWLNANETSVMEWIMIFQQFMG
jgi:hypothetical protein